MKKIGIKEVRELVPSEPGSGSDVQLVVHWEIYRNGHLFTKVLSSAEAKTVANLLWENQ